MTTPSLSIDGGEQIGRLYRKAGAPMPTAVQYVDGRATLRKRDAEASVLSGALVPSITNVIGTRNQPHLMKWYGKKAAEEAVRVAREFPALLSDKPGAAVTYLKSAAERDRDAAASQGDAVHNACEDLARGLPCPALPAQQMLFIDSWKAWLDTWQPEFLSLESTVYGTTASGLGYAGTGDLIFKVNGMTVAADYKTNRRGLSGHDLALQLSAIIHATEVVLDPDSDESTVPMFAVDAAVGIHLSPEGFQVKQVAVDGQPWDAFCALRQVWDAHVLDGVMRNGQKMLGSSLPGPQGLVPRAIGTDCPVDAA